MDPGISPYLAVSRFTCMISRHLMRNFLALMRGLVYRLVYWAAIAAYM